MQYSIALIAALAGVASAYFQPDIQKNPQPTGNDIFTPNAEIVPAGKPFKITWKPTTPGKVSILLLQGPANNVQYLDTIADEIDNSGSFVWNVSPSLTPKDTNYAIEIVAQDRTYQYSSQIGISKADGTSGGSGSSSSYGAIETAPPTSTAVGTAVCGALDECHNSTKTSSTKKSKTTHAATGTSNVTSPVVTPTAPMTVPESLSTVAVPNGPITQTSIAVVGAPGAGNSATGAPARASSVSSGFAAPGAKLSGAAALVAGLLGFLAL